MKKLKGLFLLITAVLFSLVNTSCGGGGSEEELDPFYAYAKGKSPVPGSSGNGTLAKFIENAYSGNTIIIDCRAPEAYDAGHLENAVNIEATAQSTVEGGDFEKRLKELDPTFSKRVYMYGSVKVVYNVTAGRVSKMGYGKPKSHIYIGKYEDIVEMYPEKIVK